MAARFGGRGPHFFRSQQAIAEREARDGTLLQYDDSRVTEDDDAEVAHFERNLEHYRAAVRAQQRLALSRQNVIADFEHPDPKTGMAPVRSRIPGAALRAPTTHLPLGATSNVITHPIAVNPRTGEVLDFDDSAEERSWRSDVRPAQRAKPSAAKTPRWLEELERDTRRGAAAAAGASRVASVRAVNAAPANAAAATTTAEPSLVDRLVRLPERVVRSVTAVADDLKTGRRGVFAALCYDDRSQSLVEVLLIVLAVVVIALVFAPRRAS